MRFGQMRISNDHPEEGLAPSLRNIDEEITLEQKPLTYFTVEGGEITAGLIAKTDIEHLRPVKELKLWIALA